MNKILTVVLTLSVMVAPVFAWGVKVDAHSLRITKQVKMKLLRKLEVPVLLKSNFNKMNDSLLIRIVSFSLGLFLILCPTAVNADEIDESLIESDTTETVQSPKQMTEKQINDLFGEDPYLGQTSYLQSPDGFSQR